MNRSYFCLSRWIVIGVMILLTSCTGLYYYPDNIEYSHPRIDGLEVKEVTIRTEDNESLHVWNLPARRLPQATVIQFHGNAQNISSHYRILSWLPEAGVNLVTFDYRGYGKSTGSPFPEGLIKDGRAIINHVCQNTKGPVFVVGQSLGGAVAVPALATLTDHCICGLVIDSSFPSYRRVVREKMDMYWFTRYLSHPLSWFFSESFAPEKYLDRISVPTRVLHSRTDRVIPYSEGKAFYDGLKMTNKEFWIAKGESGRSYWHIAGFSESQALREKLLQFIARRGSRSCAISR